MAWFPAKDVCDVLGLANARTAVPNSCDPEDYRTVAKAEVSIAQAMGISFPNRGMLCVTEDGLYDLVGTSRKPEARRFRKWVHGTVLPTIRKDGMYVMGEEKVETEEDILCLTSPDAPAPEP